MDVTYSVCCETCIQDLRTNSLSLINVIEEIQVVSFPVLMQKLTVVVALERTADEAQSVSLRLVGDVNNATVFDFLMSAEFQGKLRTRMIGEMQGILLPSAGTLRVKLMNGDNEIAKMQIAMLQVATPQLDLFNAPTGPTGPSAPIA